MLDFKSLNIADHSLASMTGQDEITVMTANPIEETSIIRALAKAWPEALEKAPHDLYIPFTGQDRGIALLDDADNIIGFITWTDQRGASAWVTMGWVAEEYRNEKVYDLLWAELVEQVRAGGFHGIIGSTGPDNVPMQACMARHGRTLASMIYKVDLTKQ